MPYISQHARDALDVQFPQQRLNAGQLNYLISALMVSQLGTEVHYARINELIGALECAKLELYRRVAVPYEDAKIKENGDVFYV